MIDRAFENVEKNKLPGNYLKNMNSLKKSDKQNQSGNSNHSNTEKTNRGGAAFLSFWGKLSPGWKIGIIAGGVFVLLMFIFMVCIWANMNQEGNLTNLDIANDVKETSYLDDKFEDSIMYDNNVVLVGKITDYSLDNLKDYYGNNYSCDSNKENCVDGTETKFFQKMYDIYYLYRSKYNVKLDLTLLMATLIYFDNDMGEVFKNNLSDYDREALVESDWNPKETMELDWDYDYESKYNYLKSNDFSMDMQVLAKNMVTKTTVWKCYKDNEVTKSLEVKNDSEKLECGEGETLSADQTTYKLDLDTPSIPSSKKATVPVLSVPIAQ